MRLALLAALVPALASAQLSVRPGSTRDHPHDVPWDVSGRSLKAPRLRALHAPTDVQGSSVWLIRNDPMLAYALGRDLNLRDWQLRDGVFGEPGRLVGFTRPRLMGGGGGGTLPRDDSGSCATCHNVPFGEPGAGPTIPKDAGTGRNTPHLFGGGLQEMIGERIRASILTACDTNGDGRITPEEAKGKRATVRTQRKDGVVLDFGACGDETGEGVPDIEPQVRAYYLDAKGQWVAWGTSLKTPGVAAWAPEPQVFGHGQADGALTSTLRAFFVQAADVHTGLQAYDPLLVDDPDQDGLSGTSPSGMVQTMTVRPRDRGRVLTAAGVSRDDPDRDGALEELSCGDVDLAEHFLLHVPPPAEKSTARAREGRKVFDRIGCATCHVADWELEHDRRLFRVDVAPGPSGTLEGKLVWTARKTETGLEPEGKPFLARGVYSDFRRHDLGPESHELGFDGTVLRKFRTAPLWGVGSTAPYFHDGASLSLEDAVERHGGEAAETRARWRDLSEPERDALMAFLNSLVLYGITDLPTDVDGDGKVAMEWTPGGRPTYGPERFNPELLSQVPCELEGPTRGYGGEPIISRACLNIPAMYRMDLKARKDMDQDGFPDVRDDCPEQRGYLDGCKDPPGYTGE